MADTYTTNLNLTKPEPGAAEDTWGISLNADLDSLDAIFSTSGTQINLNPNQINFADGKKAVFGNSSDLSIYHDGSNSYIKNSGTGNLYIQDTDYSGDVYIQAQPNENSIIAYNNSSVVLFYDNAQKLTTQSTGINVTGTVTSDGLTVDGVARAGNGGVVLEGQYSSSFPNPSANGYFQLKTNNQDVNRGGITIARSSDTSGTMLDALRIDYAGDISFYDDTGTSQNLKWDASADTLNFVDNAKAAFGAGNDLQIYHTGSHSYIDSYTGNLHISSDSLQLKSKTGGENYIRAFLNGAVDIYYDNSAKLATTSTGIDVTGTVTSDGLVLGDNDKAVFNSNLNIFSTGTSSYIEEVGTGDLYLKASNLYITDRENNQFMSMIDNGTGGTLSLKHLGSTVLTTQSTGIDVTGTVTSDGLTVGSGNITASGNEGVVKIATVNSGSGTLWTDINTGDNAYSSMPSEVAIINSADNTTNSFAGVFFQAGEDSSGLAISSARIGAIRTGSATTDLSFATRGVGGMRDRLRVFSGGDISFYDDTGSTQGLFLDSSAERLGIGTTSPSSSIDVFSSDANIAKFTRDLTTDVSLNVSADNDGTILSTGGVHNFRVFTNSSESVRVTSAGKVGIGTTSPDSKLTIYNADTGITGLFKLWTNTSNNTGADGGAIEWIGSGDSTAIGAKIAATRVEGGGKMDMRFYTGRDSDSDHEKMRILVNGNVGIGTDSPSQKLHVKTDTDGDGIKIQRNSTTAGTYGQLGFSTSTNDAGNPNLWIRGYRGSAYTDNYMTFGTGGDTGSERMRLDSSGNLLVGTTDTSLYNNVSGEGVLIAPDHIQIARDSDTTAVFNRQGTDGQVITFNKSGSTVGSIGTRFSDMYLGTGDTNLRFNDADDRVNPADATGNARDAAVDLGGSSGRFKDLYLSGRVIANGVTTSAHAWSSQSDSTSSSVHLYFRNPNGFVGNIATSGTATSYNTSSDARLKDVTGEARGLEVITKLNPVAYNWKADGKADEGLIAQEVKELVPNAVTGSENEHYQMDYSKLVTHLVKAVQELEQQTIELKKEIANLKGE